MIPRNDNNNNDSLNLTNAAAILGILFLVTAIGLPEPLARLIGLGLAM